MSRIPFAACLLIGAALGTSCRSPLDAPRDQGTADLRVTASVTGTPISLIVVICRAADIPTQLVFNLPVQNGVAQGTIKLPPGSNRAITAEAYDPDGVLIADGSVTINVKPGQNPPVSIPMVSKAGQVVVTATLGSVSVVVQPTSPTLQVGTTQQFTATITAANGIVLTSDPEWATTNPAIATVDRHGVVTALMPGSVQIVATFEGVGGASSVAVASQIALASNGQIYTMNADGTSLTRLTNLATGAFFPAWSPDGTRIAFVSPEDGLWHIYVMNADGTGVTRLTNDGGGDTQPSWSPNGSQIAFTSWRDGNDEIYVMNADGTNQTRLTNNVSYDQAPAWSPNGAQIAFMSGRDFVGAIYLMNTDGTGVTRLTSSGFDDAPAWSPDGSKIAFTSDRDGNQEIYVMNADGSNQTRLTNNGAVDFEPAWSPGGTQIAFSSDRDGNNEIYVMNATGTGVVRLTNNSIDDEWPQWRAR